MAQTSCFGITTLLPSVHDATGREVAAVRGVLTSLLAMMKANRISIGLFLSTLLFDSQTSGRVGGARQIFEG